MGKRIYEIEGEIRFFKKGHKVRIEVWHGEGYQIKGLEYVCTVEDLEAFKKESSLDGVERLPVILHMHKPEKPPLFRFY